MRKTTTAQQCLNNCNTAGSAPRGRGGVATRVAACVVLLLMAVCWTRCSAQETGGKLDKALRDDVRKQLKGRLEHQLALRRLHHQEKGEQAVRAVKISQLRALWSTFERLDPLSPDRAVRRKVEATLVDTLKKLPHLASYSSFAAVNAAIEDRSVELFEEGLARLFNDRLQRAIVNQPALAKTFTLEALADEGALIERIAQQKWEIQTKASKSSFAKLPKAQQRVVRDSARNLVETRRGQLLNSAKKSIELAASDPRFVWPRVTIDSDIPRIRKQTVRDAATRLLAKAGIKSGASIPALSTQAGKVADAWFQQRHASVVQQDQLKKFDKLKQRVATFTKAGSGTDPLPAVPALPASANNNEKRQLENNYVAAVIRAAGVTRQPTSALKLQVTAFVKPIINARLALYQELAAQNKALLDYIGRNGGVNMTSDLAGAIGNAKAAPKIAVPSRPKEPQPARTQPPSPLNLAAVGGTSTSPPGVDRSQVLQNRLLQEQARRVKVQLQLREVIGDFKFDPYLITRAGLTRLDQIDRVPKGVLEKLNALVGTEFSNQTVFENAVRKALTDVDAHRYLHKIAERSRQRSYSSTVALSSSNALAVDELRKQLIEEMKGKLPADPNDPLHAFAREEADRRARELVETRKKYLALVDMQAGALAKQLGSGKDQTWRRTIQGFRDLDDPRAFTSLTGRHSVEAEIASEVLPNALPDVRDHAKVRAIIQQVISEESEVARTKLAAKLKGVIWSTRDASKPGVVRDDVVGQPRPDQREREIEKQVTAALLKEDPQMAAVMQSPGVKALVKQHAALLYKHIKYVPSPAQEKAFASVLDRARLGGVDMPTRAQVLAKPTAVDDIKAGIQKMVGRTPYREYAQKSLRFQEMIDARAKQLLPPTVATAPPSRPPIGDNGAGRPAPNAVAGGPAQPNINKPANVEPRRGAGKADAPADRDSPPPGRVATAPKQVDPNPKEPTRRGTSDAPPEPAKQVRQASAALPVAKKPMANPPSAQDFDLTVEVIASPNSSNCEVTILSKRIDFERRHRVRRDTEDNFDAGMKSVMEDLEDKTPDLILKAFSDTQGAMARFRVTMKFEGKLLPIAVPREFAIAMDKFFGELKSHNPLVDPVFETYTTGQGFQGKIQELRELN